MPYTKKQKALFFAAASDPKIAKQHVMTHAEAKRLAEEEKRTPTKKKK